MGTIGACFIPVLTTPAGAALTAAEWQAAGVSMVSLHLSSLLMRPGYETLRKIPSLASFIGWSHGLVLNAANLVARKDGRYEVRSDYDGSRRLYDLNELIVLIRTLRPTAVLLPADALRNDAALCHTLPEEIELIVARSESDYGHRRHAVYDEYDGTASHFDKPAYLFGDVSLSTWLTHPALRIESNAPASDGYRGFFYSCQGIQDVQDNERRLIMEPLDEACLCATCQQGYTQAYFHHLFTHTPLLCQRLLIQHNTFFVSHLSA